MGSIFGMFHSPLTWHATSRNVILRERSISVNWMMPSSWECCTKAPSSTVILSHSPIFAWIQPWASYKVKSETEHCSKRTHVIFVFDTSSVFHGFPALSERYLITACISPSSCKRASNDAIIYDPNFVPTRKTMEMEVLTYRICYRCLHCNLSVEITTLSNHWLQLYRFRSFIHSLAVNFCLLHLSLTWRRLEPIQSQILASWGLDPCIG